MANSPTCPEAQFESGHTSGPSACRAGENTQRLHHCQAICAGFVRKARTPLRSCMQGQRCPEIGLDCSICQWFERMLWRPFSLLDRHAGFWFCYRQLRRGDFPALLIKW